MTISTGRPASVKAARAANDHPSAIHTAAPAPSHRPATSFPEARPVHRLDAAGLEPDFARLVERSVAAACASPGDQGDVTFGDLGAIASFVHSARCHDGLMLQAGLALIAAQHPDLTILTRDVELPVTEAAQALIARNRPGELSGIRLGSEVFAREHYKADIIVVDDIVASAPDRPQMEAVARTSTPGVEADGTELARQANARSSSARAPSVRSASHAGDRVGGSCETETGKTLDDDVIGDATATPSSSATPTPAAVAETPRKRRRTIRAKAIDVGDVNDRALNGSLAAAPAVPAPGPETDAERARSVLRLLARAASSLTGADVERIVREERQRCRRACATMAFDPLRAALRDGRSDLPADLRRQVAIHEAGHAVVFRALALGEQGEMTIDAPEGGVTMTAIASMTIQSEDRLMDLLAMKLAGRAAETACGLAPHAGSGGGDGTDLQVSTALALELECRAGFNADAPLLHIEPGNTSMIHLARPDAYRKANARLEQAYETARQLIDTHRDAHGALVDALIVHGTLDGDEVDAILEGRMKKTE